MTAAPTKHAYLIMAHHQWELLAALIELLDDERNDLFIHIDKKANDVPFDKLRAAASKSSLIFAPRIRVEWGAYSQVECELLLLQEALAHGSYSYLHLLSGQDLPLKTQDYIHDFCAQHAGTNFIAQDRRDTLPAKLIDRYRYYHIIRPLTQWQGSMSARAATLINKALIKVQRACGYDRQKLLERHGLELCKGANCFSITEDCARYINDNHQLIDKLFSKGVWNADEFFLQTIFSTSAFKDSIYPYTTPAEHVQSNMRYVNWDEPHPAILTMRAAQELTETPALFARKFDMNVDADIVRYLRDFLKAQS